MPRPQLSVLPFARAQVANCAPPTPRYDPTIDTTSLAIGTDTFLIASELRHQVNIVTFALASTLITDGPPVTLCVPAYCQAAEKRSAVRMGGQDALPFEVSPSAGIENRALQVGGKEGAVVKVFITTPVSEIVGVDIEKP